MKSMLRYLTRPIMPLEDWPIKEAHWPIKRLKVLGGCFGGLHMFFESDSKWVRAEKVTRSDKS